MLRQWAAPAPDGRELWWAKPRPGGGGEAVVVKVLAAENSDERGWGAFAREWGVLSYLQVWGRSMPVLGAVGDMTQDNTPPAPTFKFQAHTYCAARRVPAPKRAPPSERSRGYVAFSRKDVSFGIGITVGTEYRSPGGVLSGVTCDICLTSRALIYRAPPSLPTAAVLGLSPTIATATLCRK